MVVINHHVPASFSVIPIQCLSYLTFSKRNLFVRFKTSKLFSIRAVQPSSSSQSSSPIFLPFLQDADEEHDDAVDVPKPKKEDEESDPLIRFFKSRTSTEDPPREGRMSLQKSRHSSWHLAADIDFVDEEKIGSDTEELLEGGKQQMGSVDFNANTFPEGVVGEILQIARSLPQNFTIGEALEGLEGRVGEEECVELLGLMGQEGLFLSCLYFFEWMGLQEPSLVTPRSCSVLFPMLGRAGMGDKLIVLLNNLPPKKEFRDVHVYNSAISGLMCSKRYGIS